MPAQPPLAGVHPGQPMQSWNSPQSSQLSLDGVPVHPPPEAVHPRHEPQPYTAAQERQSGMSAPEQTPVVHPWHPAHSYVLPQSVQVVDAGVPEQEPAPVDDDVHPGQAQPLASHASHDAKEAVPVQLPVLPPSVALSPCGSGPPSTGVDGWLEHAMAQPSVTPSRSLEPCRKRRRPPTESAPNQRKTYSTMSCMRGGTLYTMDAGVLPVLRQLAQF
jgi:hypothetical protein